MNFARDEYFQDVMPLIFRFIFFRFIFALYFQLKDKNKHTSTLLVDDTTQQHSSNHKHIYAL